MNRQESKAIEAVFDEVRLLFHRLRRVADDLHDDLKVTAAMRGALEGLVRFGPQTVPAMARARPVSRQHMQLIVNELLQRKLVDTKDNPAHKNSPLVEITNKGAELLQGIKEQERLLLSKGRIQVSEKSLTCTVESLQAIRKFFESTDWQDIVHEFKSR